MALVLNTVGQRAFETWASALVRGIPNIDTPLPPSCYAVFWALGLVYLGYEAEVMSGFYSHLCDTPCFYSNFAELNGGGTTIVGTIIASSHVTMTSVIMSGAVISLGAAVTLTGSSVRLSTVGAVGPSSPLYSTPVDLLRTSDFAILAAQGITNTVGYTVALHKEDPGPREHLFLCFLAFRAQASALATLDRFRSP
jgi:hypothetical protein